GGRKCRMSKGECRMRRSIPYAVRNTQYAPITHFDETNRNGYAGVWVTRWWDWFGRWLVGGRRRCRSVLETIPPSMTLRRFMNGQSWPGRALRSSFFMNMRAKRERGYPISIILA